ncbi:RNase P subunit p30 [Desulfurococcaceae archaeon MEX13E-LK6-19]|nr:RNase P subunit p30 [Desulfurococcaceae archaeon MEX13E-LK6-19]
MKGFVDLWVDIDPDLIDRVADIAYTMGYTVLCIEDKGFNWRTKRWNKVLVVKKRTIEAAGEKNLKEKLRGIKTVYPIVSVKPLDVQAARLAARDGRVDTIVLDKDSIDYIDKTQALMMKQFRKVLEVPINVFLESNNKIRAMMYRRIHMFYYYDVPVVFSSHARDWNQLIHPRSLVELLHTLTGIERKHLVYSISGLCVELLSKNGVRA